MVSITVGLWAINELSFDNFHKNGDRMYRIVQSFELNGKPLRAASSFKPLGEIAANEIPEIEQMCRIYVERDQGITMNNRVQFGLSSIVTDDNFFSFFTFPLKTGEPKDALSAPNNVVLSESTAKRFFPDQDPIGQKIEYHGWSFNVTGIMYDMPRNSHIQTDVVFPLFAYFKEWQWDSSFKYDTYFVLSPNADIPSIEKRLTKINLAGASSLIRNISEVSLEPVKDAHFSKTDPGFDSAIKGNKSLLITFIVIAITILIIACINFTNLFVSTSFIRAKTIGIKKSLGAGKPSLIIDFYKETAIYVVIAITIGILLAKVALPVFNNYTRSNLIIDISSPLLYIFLTGLTIFTILMAGTFPAIQMTKFNVIEILKGKFRGKRISLIQKILIIIQFTSSISLLTVVFFFGQQINHILTQDLGFDNKNIVYVDGWRDFGRNYKALREEMIKEPSITDVALKEYDPPFEMALGMGAKNMDTGVQIMLDLSEVSPNYFDFFRMEFVAGENPLTLESATSNRYCVVNERMAKLLGLEDNPIDKSFALLSIGGAYKEDDGKRFIIKGVIRDSYVKSLYQEPGPQMYLNLTREDHNPIFFKVSGDPQRAINAIEKKWKEVVPDTPFIYHFLDKTYEAQYAAEINSKNVLIYALIITFIITAMGLYAMSFYSIQRRIKEIGIRKVNGATMANLLALLNKDITVWIGISFLIACPISYFFVDNWLDNFVVRISLSIWIFLGAGALSFIIAMLTVCYQTWKAANMNPVNAIQNE
jgi:putative ABC transport system permease protein